MANVCSAVTPVGSGALVGYESGARGWTVQVLLLGHSHAMSQLTPHKAGVVVHDPDL